MIFKAILSSQASPGYGQATISFPIPDSDYDLVIRMLEDIGVGSPTAQDCRVVGLEGLYPTLKRLNGQAINVDELDYLAKRLDSFSDGEDAQFEAMAFKLGLSSIKDFINLTFCCQQATVITNFSDLERVGKSHVLTINGGAMPAAEYDQVDGRMAALDLIQNKAGTITPYGVVYDNGLELEPLYDGRHFPAYIYDPPLIELEIRSGPERTVAGYLYLPCPDTQLQRTLARAGCGQEGFRMEITTDDLPPQVSAVVSLARDGLDELNDLCRTIEPLNADQRKKLGAVVLLARPQYASEVRKLAENLGQFDFMPRPFNTEADCAMTDLGYVAYCGSMTLEELMMDGPAEQCRQKMGGMA